MYKFRVDELNDKERPYQLVRDGYHVEYFKDKAIAEKLRDELNAQEILKYYSEH